MLTAFYVGLYTKYVWTYLSFCLYYMNMVEGICVCAWMNVDLAFKYFTDCMFQRFFNTHKKYSPTFSLFSMILYAIVYRLILFPLTLTLLTFFQFSYSGCCYFVACVICYILH